MKCQWFQCFIYFARNTDIHLSGESVPLYNWLIIGSQLLVQWTTSYLLSNQNCHLFQQQFVFNIEINRSVKLSVTAQSDKHACGKQMLTDPDKQATGNREHEQKRLVTWKQYNALANLGSRGTRFHYSVDLTRVKPKLHNILRKISRAVAEAISYSNERKMRIWQILWRIIMESSDSHILSIRDKKLQNELNVE